METARLFHFFRRIINAESIRIRVNHVENEERLSKGFRGARLSRDSGLPELSTWTATPCEPQGCADADVKLQKRPSRLFPVWRSIWPFVRFHREAIKGKLRFQALRRARQGLFRRIPINFR